MGERDLSFSSSVSQSLPALRSVRVGVRRSTSLKWQRLVMIDLVVVLEQRSLLRKSAEMPLKPGRDSMASPTHLVIPRVAMEPLIAAVSLGSFRYKIGSSSPKLLMPMRTHCTQTRVGIRKFAVSAKSFFHL